MMIGVVDMRGNLIAAVIFLLVGVVVFQLLRPRVASTSSRRWLPIVAFVSAPAIAFLWSIADVVPMPSRFSPSIAVWSAVTPVKNKRDSTVSQPSIGETMKSRGFVWSPTKFGNERWHW